MAEVIRKKILCPPGTGKTHTLIDEIKKEINVNKIDPKKIIYITFNKDLAFSWYVSSANSHPW